jgi:uracil-DNA glycosylase
MLTPETTEELLNLALSLRAHLEAEAELGTLGLSPLALPADPEPSHADDRVGLEPVTAEHARLPQSAAAPSPSEPALVPVPAAARGDAVAALLSGEERRQRLQLMAEEAKQCTACVLHEKRNKSVFARGSPDSEIVFVGEGPGRDEDQQGLPFVGAAGQLLDRMIAAMGYGRDEVYICNVVKCRPPENRTPRPEEMLACAKFLVPQLETISPKVIVALGRCAAQALGVAEATGSWRGRWGQWRGVPTLPTYHPAFLLRSPEFKRTVWEDLQLVMGRLGRTPRRA